MFGDVEQVRTAVKNLAAVDTDTLTDTELCEATAELVAVRAALEGVHARLAAAVDARAAYPPERQGTVAFLAAETRAWRKDCQSLLHLGRRLRSSDAVTEALVAGDITAAHARRLLAANNNRAAAHFRRDVHMLLDWAKTMPFAVFADALDEWSLHADPDGADDRDIDRRDRRRVSLDQTIFNMWSGTILLDPISGEIVATELNRLEQKLFDTDWAKAREKLGREPQIHELERTPDQRRADALVQMAARSASTPPGAQAPRPLFTVVLGDDSLKRASYLFHSGTVVAPAAMLPWVDQADVEAILFEPGRRAIAASRKRNFTGALRKIIQVRDRYCTTPGCDVPAGQCQADHKQPHSAGGLTSQENGEAACGPDNRHRWKQWRQQHPPPAPDDG